jgi:hypothetical protein
MLKLALRSRALAAPLVLLAAAVIVLYAAPPNPVISTARAVAVYTAPIQVWLALAVLNAAAAADRQVLAATVGRSALAGGRLLAAATTTAGAALLTVAYPVLVGRFDHTPTAAQLAACAGLAAGAAVVATALAAVFARPGVRNPAVGALGPASAVLLGLALPLVVDAALLAGAATLACTTRWD